MKQRATLFSLLFAALILTPIVPNTTASYHPAPALPAAVTIPETPIDVCSQHPMVCPLEPTTWPGEAGGWQYTAKKWPWYPGSPDDPKKLIWQSSEPYSGTNPTYAGYRENHYSDYTNTPDLYPAVPGTPPIIYDWSLWIPTDGSYKLHRYGRPTEQESFFVGTPDCYSGVHYAVVDSANPYAYTPMSVIRGDTCVPGGYINAHLIEEWGAPMTPQRIAGCDNAATGVPADVSVRGNTICKTSPHAGIVYQGYVWGAGSPPYDRIDIGCEAVLYIWGWPHPWQPGSGQAYQSWFRNGELRLTMWINLGQYVTNNTIPAPDDVGWWKTHCDSAWNGVANYYYDGVFRVGANIYTDTGTLPPVSDAIIPPGGGVLTASMQAEFTFAAGTFNSTAVISHVAWLRNELAPPGLLVQVDGMYVLTATNQLNGASIEPVQPYSVTLRYDDAARGTAVEQTLALYYWDGAQWHREPTSAVDPTTRTITAGPNRLGTWAVLGETRRTFLPGVTR